MSWYDKFEDVEAVDSLGVWYKCEAVEVKDEDHYLVTFTSWPSNYICMIALLENKKSDTYLPLGNKNVALLLNHR